jgi:hypothetical protein
MKKVVSLFLVVILIFSLFGCAGTMRAIEHSSMTTKVKMSDSIILDASSLAKNRTVYVRVTNTSDMQEIQFEPMLRVRLEQKGLKIVSDPDEAGYIIQANVLYMNYAKDASMTADGMAAGGIGGALLGSGIGSGWRGNTAGAIGGAMIGSIVGGLAGKLISVDRYIGVVDVKIQERVIGGVSGTVKSDIKQGASTTIATERNIQSNYQTYTTRIAAEAVRTNINKEEAANAISDKLATQISSIF